MLLKVGPHCFLKMKTLKADNRKKVVSIKKISFPFYVSVIMRHQRLSAMLFQRFGGFVLFWSFLLFVWRFCLFGVFCGIILR